MNCELDKEIFECCKCKGKFNHTQGTWLPIGITDPNPVEVLSPALSQPMVIGLWMAEPEIITSDKFTCYDCIE